MSTRFVTKVLGLLLALNAAPLACLAVDQGEKTVLERESFSSASWKARKTKRGTVREKQFCAFLDRFDLIGMSRKDLLRLLGENEAYKGNSSSERFDYWIYSAGCGCSVIKIEMQLDGDKVARWREAGTMSCCDYEGPWISENVIAIPCHRRRDGQLYLNIAPKRAQQLICPPSSACKS